MRLLLSATLLSLGTVAGAQEKDAPAGQPPYLWLASASRVGKTVVVQIAKPEERGGADSTGFLGRGVQSLPGSTVTKWNNLQKVTLGQTVRAFGVDGMPANADAVLQALARPRGVAVFVRAKDSDPARPDPFYLALLREDTLVLVVHQRDLYPKQP